MPNDEDFDVFNLIGMKYRASVSIDKIVWFNEI